MPYIRDWKTANQEDLKRIKGDSMGGTQTNSHRPKAKLDLTVSDLAGSEGIPKINAGLTLEGDLPIKDDQNCQPTAERVLEPMEGDSTGGAQTNSHRPMAKLDLTASDLAGSEGIPKINAGLTLEGGVASKRGQRFSTALDEEISRFNEAQRAQGNRKRNERLSSQTSGRVPRRRVASPIHRRGRGGREFQRPR